MIGGEHSRSARMHDEGEHARFFLPCERRSPGGRGIQLPSLTSIDVGVRDRNRLAGIRLEEGESLAGKFAVCRVEDEVRGTRFAKEVRDGGWGVVDGYDCRV